MIQSGSTVKILYTLTVEGQVVSRNEPVTYVQGQGQILPGLEEELLGLGQGVKATVKVPPERGFGKRNPGAVREVPKSAFKHPERLNEGDPISVESGGEPINARVVEVRPNRIVLDLNHPLAGKTLDFEVEVVEVS